MSRPLLQLTDVVAGYGPIHALNGLSMAVGEGEIITLLGANGAGKSTTLRTISGLLHPAQGTITFGGQRIDRASAESIVQRGIAHVPEGRHIFPGLSVRDNLLLGTSNHRLPKGHISAQLDRVMELFPDLRRLSGLFVEHKRRARMRLASSTQAHRFVTVWISQAPPGAQRVTLNELELFPAAK